MVVLLLVSCAPADTEEEEVTESPEGRAAEQAAEVVESAEALPSEEKEWSKEQSEAIATRLLRSSATFSSRGIKDSLKLLATTPLDHPFSWQFDYEFECQYPGYGWLGSEPTPPMITPHEAQVVVQDGVVVEMNGVLGGAIPKQSLVEAIESLPQDEFCPNPDKPNSCISKEVLVGLVAAVIQDDIDTDGDGKADAASIALEFEAISAEVVGIQM